MMLPFKLYRWKPWRAGSLPDDARAQLRAARNWLIWLPLLYNMLTPSRKRRTVIIQLVAVRTKVYLSV